jgi:hypothetical protein
MAEFFRALWETWKPGQPALIGLVAVSPFLSGLVFSFFNFTAARTLRRRSRRKCFGLQAIRFSYVWMITLK